MKIFAKSTLVLLSYFAINSVFAENLIELYNLAKDHDPIIQAAYENHKAQIEELPQARALLLPKIEATSNATKSNSSDATKKDNTWQYGITISQPIFQIGDWSKLSQAKDTVKAAFADLTDAEQSLLLRISQQYFEVLKAQDNLKFTKAEQKAFVEQLEQTKQRYKVGLLAITDVHEAQATHDSGYAKVIEAENNLENVKEKLRELIGQDIIHLAPLKTTITPHAPTPTNAEKWVQLALEKNWKLQAARYNLAISRKQIQENRAGNYPTLQLKAGIDKLKNPSGATETKSTDRNIGLVFNMPLFSGGSVISKTRQASYNYEKATKNLEGQHRTTESDTRQAYLGILSQLSQIKALKQAVISNTSSLKATKAAFEVGNRTIVDVSDAQSYLIKAEKNLANARYDYILKTLTLKQVTGILSVEDLQEINGWLE